MNVWLYLEVLIKQWNNIINYSVLIDLQKSSYVDASYLFKVKQSCYLNIKFCF